MGLTKSDAKALCDRILGLVKADSAEVWVSDSSDQHLRYANNDITSNSLTERVDTHLSVSYGKRSASISTNQTSDTALREMVEKVQAMARLAPEDPEFLPPVEPADYAEPATWAESTARAAPGEAIERVRPVIEQARAAGVDSAGYLKRSVGGSALANSRGLFVHQRATSVGFSLTARTAEGNGSGWASTQVTDIADLDLAPIGERAIRKALDSRNPVERAPGRTTVVLEPAAVRDLISLLIWDLDRRSFDEGRSFLNGLVADGGDPIGAALFGERATLVSDPLFPEAPCGTHSGGLPLVRTPWIEKGVLKTLKVGRYWAQEKKLPPQPGPGNVIMPGDGVSMDELIGQVDDGVLITRLWYLRMVQPQTLLYTGLTRDGTFSIQNGKVAGPVKNFRFNESPVNVLRQIVASGIPARVLGSESDMPFHVPPLVVRDFNLSSVSEAS
jgi:predicted Zn-dependent protease